MEKINREKRFSSGAGCRPLKSRITINIRDNIQLLLVTSSFLAYVIVWSYMTILQLYTMNEAYWDLGAFAHRGIMVVTYPWSIRFFLYTFFGSEWTFIIFPLVLLKSLRFLLIVQSISIGVAIFPLYGIVSKFFKNGIIRTLLPISYLIYFPMAGMNWFTMHYQVFFVPLFIFGYYFYVYGKYRLAMLFFVLSGTVRFPFILLVVYFSGIWLFLLLWNLYRLNLAVSKLWHTVVEKIFKKRPLIRSEQPEENRSNDILMLQAKFFTYLLIISSAIAIISTVYLNYYHETITGVARVRGPATTLLLLNFREKVITLILILAPYLFMIFLSKKWLLLLLPYLYLLFFSNNPNYMYPLVFMYQYSSIFTAFIVLGSIEGIHNYSTRLHKINNGVIKSRRSEIQRTYPRKIVYIVVSIFIISAAFASFFEPYGPFNGEAPDNFGLTHIMSENSSAYSEAKIIIDLIPENNSFIMFQNHFPELGFRDFGKNPILTTYTINYNMTYFNPETSSYEKIGNVDYLLVSAYYDSAEFVAPFDPPHNLSFLWLAHNFYGSGKYGILAEASGMLLLERNYSGPIIYFVPLSEVIPVTNLYNYHTHALSSTSVMQWENTSNSPLWYGPYISLVPGYYKITFQLKTNNNSARNHFEIFDDALLPYSFFNDFEIYGSNFSKTNTWTNISTTIYVNNSYGYVNLQGVYAYWNGSISIGGIKIQEIRKPPSVFGAGNNYYEDVIYNGANSTGNTYSFLVSTSSYNNTGGRSVFMNENNSINDSGLHLILGIVLQEFQKIISSIENMYKTIQKAYESQTYEANAEASLKLAIGWIR
ncbi:MAG: DUF2079 domain-containing protein [Nitrososphaerota archaeon]